MDGNGDAFVHLPGTQLCLDRHPFPSTSTQSNALWLCTIQMIRRCVLYCLTGDTKGVRELGLPRAKLAKQLRDGLVRGK